MLKSQSTSILHLYILPKCTMPILKGIGLYQSRTTAECNFGLAGWLCTATTSMLDVRELGQNYWRGHPFTVYSLFQGQMLICAHFWFTHNFGFTVPLIRCQQHDAISWCCLPTASELPAMGKTARFGLVYAPPNRVIFPTC